MIKIESKYMLGDPKMLEDPFMDGDVFYLNVAKNKLAVCSIYNWFRQKKTLRKWNYIIQAVQKRVQAIRTIQAWLRSVFLRENYLQLKKSIIILQACTRSWHVRNYIIGGGLKRYRRALTKCCQKEPIKFDDILKKKSLTKIGQGTYGHCYADNNGKSMKTIYKIIPVYIFSKDYIKGRCRLDTALVDFKACKALNSLRTNTINKTYSYIYMHDAWLVKDIVPFYLKNAEYVYNEVKREKKKKVGLGNDNQLYYLVEELDYGGIEIFESESLSPAQIVSIIAQLCFAFAVAETALEFEHRDLHEGNILLKSTSKKYVTYTYRRKKFSIPSNGIKVTIIDFSLARYKFEEKVEFVELSDDEDDFRYNENKGDWAKFCPKVNKLEIKTVGNFLLNYGSENYYKKDNDELYENRDWINQITEYDTLLDYYDYCLKPLLKSMRMPWYTKLFVCRS